MMTLRRGVMENKRMSLRIRIREGKKFSKSLYYSNSKEMKKIYKGG